MFSLKKQSVSRDMDVGMEHSTSSRIIVGLFFFFFSLVLLGVSSFPWQFSIES